MSVIQLSFAWIPKISMDIPKPSHLKYDRGEVKVERDSLN